MSKYSKSTFAKSLAKSLGFIYIDTGAMYRAITLFFRINSLLNKDGTTNSIYLDDMGAGIHLNQKAMPLIIKEMKLKSLFLQ